MERLAKCHLTEDVKRNHLIPMPHVQSSWRVSQSLDLLNHCVDTSLDRIFLFQKCFCGESNGQVFLHSGMPPWVALAPDAFRVVACREHVVEVALDAMLLACGWVAIYGFPGLHGSKREFVWGDPKNGTWPCECPNEVRLLL